MTDLTPLGPWVRRFLLEHLVGEPESGAEYPTQLPRRPRAAAPVYRRLRPQKQSISFNR